MAGTFDKDAVIRLLRDRQIPFEMTEHAAVYNMAQARELPLLYPEAEAKNLFVRDDKKRQYYLITVKGDKRVDLKAFRKAYGTRPLSFAGEKELMDILGLIPGAVTPFGLLNDEEKRVIFCLDEAFTDENVKIGCHPNDNCASVWLRSADLLSLLSDRGTQVMTVRI